MRIILITVGTIVFFIGVGCIAIIAVEGFKRYSGKHMGGNDSGS